MHKWRHTNKGGSGGSIVGKGDGIEVEQEEEKEEKECEAEH